MNQDKPLILRALRSTWRFIDGARKVFLNLLFLLVLVLLFAIFAGPETSRRLQGDTTLVLQPYGEVVEQYSTSPIDRALQQAMDETVPETRLRDLIEAVDRAAGDPRITQLLIDTDYLWGIGLSSLRDLEHAVLRFKETGKPVIAVGDAMGQHQYYLAALADEIWLHPDGLVWIDGYSNVRHFFREGLDKLEVEINLFRVGDYKSAMEPFVRNDMSEEARENALVWLGSLWQQYLEGVSRQRGLPLDKISEAVNTMADGIEAVDGDFAQYALELGLVDRLISRPEARHELALRGAPDREGDGFRGVLFDEYLELTAPASAGRPGAQIAVLVAEGEIVNGHQGPGRVGSESTVEQLLEIGRDPDLRAVVLRIDSPGGDAMASEKIRGQVQALREAGKTVVVSMGDVAASGGYWIAMSADEVWASPVTITGSIGVFGLIPTFGATLEKIGVHTDGVGTTDLAGKLRLDRPLDPDLRRIFQSSTEHVYRDFLELVAAARGMETAAVDRVAQGQVWTGAQAAELGLVDRTGTLQDAIDAAARIAGLGGDYRVTWHEQPLSPFERFMLDLTGGAASHFSWPVMGSGWVPPGFVQRMVDQLRLVAGAQGRFTVAAHCLCGVF